MNVGTIKWGGNNSFVCVAGVGEGRGRNALWVHMEIKFCLDVLSVRCINCSRSIWRKLLALELRVLSLNSGLSSSGFLKCSFQISSSSLTWEAQLFRSPLITSEFETLEVGLAIYVLRSSPRDSLKFENLCSKAYSSLLKNTWHHNCPTLDFLVPP